MDLIKLYITQSISEAANNLRLTSQQIEAVTSLKGIFNKTEDVESIIRKMKKITELSTLGIRLHEIYLNLKQHPVDISQLSLRFRKHSQMLVNDLFNFLTKYSAGNVNDVFEKLKDNVNIEINSNAEETEKRNSGNEKIEEKIISETDYIGKNSFENFEKAILEPIKPIDLMLKKITENNELPEDFESYSGIMEKNSQISAENGFEILSGLHSVVADSFRLISEGKLKPENETIEAMRACLIVIAAVVRGKEVDISNYLNKAELFVNKIKMLKSKEEN